MNHPFLFLWHFVIAETWCALLHKQHHSVSPIAGHPWTFCAKCPRGWRHE